MFRERRRRGPKGRKPKPVRLEMRPQINRSIPFPLINPAPIHLEPAELEALRLVDLEGLSQDEAGTRMGVSRGTVWRLLQSARKKVIQSLTEGRPLLIRS